MMRVPGWTRTMRKGGVNSPRDAAVGEQFWRAEVVRDNHTPPLQDWCDRGGHGRRRRHCLIGAVSSAIVDGLCHVFREEISVRHRPHVGITQRLLISKRAQVFIWYLKSWTKHNLNLFARMNILLWWLCPRPPDPNTLGKLRLSAFCMCSYFLVSYWWVC